MKLNDADKIYIGSAEASAVYAGSTLAWEPEEAPTEPTERLIVSYTPTTQRNDWTGEVGLKFVVGTAQTISFIGMRCGKDNSNVPNTGLSTVRLYLQGGTPTLQRGGAVDFTGKAYGDWVWLAVEPFTLAAGQTYCVVRVTTNGDGQYWSEAAPVTLKALASSPEACYRGGSGPFNYNGTNAQYVGCDLGW